ncbi:AraC family transcriptional regulator [Actinoplanes sp. NPDC023714]|uniref:AraC family transcriptional regulator n=1 Tax=Actinoplanes sp. NPDC023714 TaxID=3154322 RepID=UPI0033FE5737
MSVHDPLEDVLALVGVTSSLSVSLAAGGDWALDFAPPPAVKFNAVVRGSCLLTVSGIPSPIPLAEGDCFLMVQPRAFTLASGPGVPPVPAGPLFQAAAEGVVHVGETDSVRVIGGRFDFGDRARDLLLDALPPVLHVPGATPAAATLRWSLDRIDEELRERAMGSALVTAHLAQIMLIHMLRLHHAPGSSASGPAASVRPGLLAGLADPVVAPALRALHARPARAWTVADLARESAVSRSTLAARFRRTVGRGPLDYLTGWRIELAAASIRRGDDTLAVIAQATGYGSESALSNAFKRVTGQSPREYRRRTLPPRSASP